MKLGQFQFNKHFSQEFGCLLKTIPKKNKATRVIELKEVSGLNGSTILDKGYYQNTTWDLDFFFLVHSISERQWNEDLITSWLDTRGQYAEFVGYWDPEYIYDVIPTSQLAVEWNRLTGRAADCSIQLSVRPFKRKIRGTNVQTFTSNFSLHNPEQYSSDPKITLYGNGDMELMINRRKTILKDVREKITIDCTPEIREVYQEISGAVINQSHKMKTLTFPYLGRGKNDIQLKNIKKVEIEPRWQTKV